MLTLKLEMRLWCKWNWPHLNSTTIAVFSVPGNTKDFIHISNKCLIQTEWPLARRKVIISVARDARAADNQ